MLHLFLTLLTAARRRRSLSSFPSQCLVAALIAAFGEKFKQSVVLHPRPGTPVLSLLCAILEDDLRFEGGV